MRKFATDAPDIMAFTLGDDETVYKMPLPASMPFKFTIALADVAAMDDGDAKNAAALKAEHAILREYIGDAADMLTARQVGEIFGAWNAEAERRGENAGE